MDSFFETVRSGQTSQLCFENPSQDPSYHGIFSDLSKIDFDRVAPTALATAMANPVLGANYTIRRKAQEEIGEPTTILTNGVNVPVERARRLQNQGIGKIQI